MAELTSRLSKLNPFSKARDGEYDDEEFGEEIDASTIAGGGHGARQTDVTKNQLRVSPALKAFLVDHGVLPDDADADAAAGSGDEAVRALLDKPHISVPPEVTDRSHPLPDYFISSSHNTYLMAHQLFGKSAAVAYETALSTGSRCVEIDAWDNEDDKDEPKVTHGYTLVSHIPFRAVCETIRDVVDKEAEQSVNAQGYRAAPIFLSLENHCGAHGQRRLVDIMTEVWAHRLLSKAVREKGHGEQVGEDDPVRLDELGSKIAVIVEHHLPEEQHDSSSDSSSSSSSSSEDEEKQARRTYRRKRKAEPAAAIVPELAALGIYAQSVKPSNASWYDPGVLKDGPHHHLINVSETGLSSLLPVHAAKIARHNSRHLMRVFPKGTRISSKNLDPAPFWGIGAQICALNWQTFNSAMQLNEALFSGTDGYVLKPAALRGSGDGNLGSGRKKKLRLHVAGATDVPIRGGREKEDEEIKPYLTCTLIHPGQLRSGHPKRKTAVYKPGKLAGLLRSGVDPPPTEPVWNEVLEWEYNDNELVFLRLMVKSDDAWSTNPLLAVTAVRLLYVTPGWNFIRMLDLKGRETKCTILVKFELEDI